MAHELSDEDRPVLEEHSVAEYRGMIGGRRIATTPDGKLQRTTFVATCDRCGRYPLDTFVMCFSCRARLCTDETSCSVRWNGIPYCRACLMEFFPMPRNAYKILRCVQAGIDDVAEIKEITKIPKDDVKGSLAFLIERKLISSSGLFAFLERKITADGLHALSVFKKVYDEEDVREVEQQLNGEDGDGE